MKPIFVPAPPKSAFNKNRAPSDLLIGQLQHFRHVEHRQGIDIDPVLAKDVHSEGGAARYITQMTRAIRSQASTKSSKVAAMAPVTPRRKKLSKAHPKRGLSLAAAVPIPHVPSKKKTPKANKKRIRKSNARKKS
jgi:hypothetical protein